MWEAKISVREELIYSKGNTLKPEDERKPKEEKHVTEDRMQDVIEGMIADRKERKARLAESIRQRRKRQHKRKNPKARQYEFSEDALARMDQRRYNKQIEREGTITPKQAAYLTDYSNGLSLTIIAMKNRVSMGAVVNQLSRIRERLDAFNNVHAVKIALQKGLIQ
ncbi:MAG: hypothetical protein F4X63_09230 [Nitrospira sp. SB0662_bin_26]|nr:hypothetical protein [Nitrospira sp. SB0662_bin_26]